MRFIDLKRLRGILGEDQYQSWVELATQHLNSIRNLNHEERSEYFSKNSDWTQLYSALSELSDNKCWYSESPEGACEFEVDHFRPKNRSRQKDGSIINEDGYWWLAYELTNLRLAGSLVNRRRKDRFKVTEEVKGKGDYFPLNLDEGTVCEPEGDLEYEVPYVLDPISFHDTTLLGFDKDGKPIPTAENGSFEYERADVSIDLLGLDHTPLNRQRKQVWENCENKILEMSKKIKSATGGALRNKVLRDACEQIRQLASKEKAYSSVALNCVHANSVEYTWLKPLLVHLG